ncbi:MAG: CHAT domain-containing protein [Bacteroidia bacterium]|nr:CHAT domain-containing protein [Bacteroidia bacterium]
MKSVFYCVLTFFVLFNFAQSWQSAYDSCVKYQKQQHYKKAAEWGDIALSLYEKQAVTKDTNYSSILESQVNNLYNLGMYQQAEILAKKDSAYSKNNTERYISCCNALSLIYQRQGKYSIATHVSNETIKIALKTIGKKNLIYANSCNNLGLLHMSLGRYIEAETLFKEGMKVVLEVVGDSHPEYPKFCNNLAFLCQTQGKYPEAELYYKEAKEKIAKTLTKESYEYVLCCNNLSALYILQGRFFEAEELYKESKKIVTKILTEKHPTYANICNSLGFLYQTYKKYLSAESLYVEAQKIIQELLGKEHPHYALVCNNLARLYLLQGRYDEAEHLYKESADIHNRIFGKEHPDYAQSCNGLAGLYQEQGKYTEAELLFKEAKEIFAKTLGREHPNYALSCNNLARLYADQDKHSKAESLYKQVLFIKLKEIQSNFKNLSENEKEKYVQANINKYFNNFQLFVLKRHLQNPAITQESYNLVLQTKGLILQSTEKIKNRILNSKDEELKKLYVEWKLTKDQYAKAQNLTINEREQKKINLDSLAQQANELEKRLALKSEDFAHTFTPKTITWKDIQNVLKKDQAAIEMVKINTKDRPNAKDSIVYMALIVKKNSSNPEVVILNNGNELENQYITNYRRSITAKTQDTESYTVFWKPIAERLKGIRTVYFSPDGVYHQINVSTLYNPQSKKYVFDEIQVINVTNTKDILSKQSYTSKNNYLIGNPKFDLQIESEPNNQKPKQERVFEGFLEGLSQLEGAEREVKRIAGLLPNSTVVTGVAATEEFVKSLKNPRILHIATHGYFKKGQYQSSTQAMLNAGLLFAGVVDYDRMEMRPLDKEDGKLTAFEVMNMELDSTELVVLSACETGLGQASKEGVYGLQRAFKVAGARSIIMSLWKVNDEATQLLMTKFYENWQKKGMPKRKAFEVAQKQIRKHYKQPYYWGAFVMVE